MARPLNGLFRIAAEAGVRFENQSPVQVGPHVSRSVMAALDGVDVRVDGPEADRGHPRICGPCVGSVEEFQRSRKPFGPWMCSR